MSNHVCYFELMVSDTEKTKAFYGKVFDWKFSEYEGMPGYVNIDTGKEPMGGIMKKPAEAPSFNLSVYFYVDSIDETLEKVGSAGGSILFPRTEIPNIGWWALFMDPDGIPVMLYENKS
jgi:predicted enzyme related to lactoylglutathione lyase